MKPLMGYAFSLNVGYSMASGKEQILGGLNYATNEAFDIQSRFPRFPPEALLSDPIAGLVDERTESIYFEMRLFEVQINQHLMRNSPCNFSVLQDFCGAIFARLLSLQSALEDTMSECVRLGLLAILTISMFHTRPWTAGIIGH